MHFIILSYTPIKLIFKVKAVNSPNDQFTKNAIILPGCPPTSLHVVFTEPPGTPAEQFSWLAHTALLPVACPLLSTARTPHAALESFLVLSLPRPLPLLSGGQRVPLRPQLPKASGQQDTRTLQ